MRRIRYNKINLWRPPRLGALKKYYAQKNTGMKSGYKG